MRTRVEQRACRAMSRRSPSRGTRQAPLERRSWIGPAPRSPAVTASRNGAHRGYVTGALGPGGRSLAVVLAAGELDQRAGGLGDLRGIGRLRAPPLAEPVVVVARDHVNVQVEDGL